MLAEINLLSIRVDFQTLDLRFLPGLLLGSNFSFTFSLLFLAL
jgi:hypothetical protein